MHGHIAARVCACACKTLTTPPKIATCCDLKSARILKVILKFSFGSYIFTIYLFADYMKVLLGLRFFKRIGINEA